MQAEATIARQSVLARTDAAVQLFGLLERSLTAFTAEAGEGMFSRRWLRFGSLDSGTFTALLQDLEEEHPLELKSPFEDVESIAGALWLGSELVHADRSDGIAKLRFQAGTVELPMHVHEHSDRLIVVLNGNGVFHVSNESLASFTGANVRGIAVEPGDVLMFTRNLLHTFSAPSDNLLLLSYHSPAIAFDDQLQFTLPSRIWTPRDAGADVR